MKKRSVKTGAALAASVFLVFICGIAMYQTMGFVYAIADDVIMRDIASGAFTGTPDGHLIFVKYALGVAISCMYTWNSSVDWYGFFMTGVIFLSLAAVIYRGLSGQRSLKWKAVYAGITLGIFGCGMLFHIAQFEWTVSAAAAGAGALYLYVTMRTDENGGKLLDAFLIWLLLILTYGIRDDVFLMVLPGFGIVFLWKFFRKEEGKFLFNWRQLLLPAAVFGTIAVMILAEQQAYQGKEWEQFRTFQSARSDVYDYYGVPVYESNPAFFDKAGLNEAELRNLRHYALYLVDDMDAELMRSLAEEGKRQSGQQGVKAKIRNGILLAAEQAVDKEYFTVSIPFLIFLAAVLYLIFRYYRKAVWPLLLFLAAEGCLWLYLGIMGRLPERVAFSMHLVTLAGTAGAFLHLWGKWEESARKGDGHKRKHVFVTVLLVCSLAAAAWQWIVSSQANEEKLAMDDSYQQFKLSCKEHPENLYFIETFMAEPVGGARVSTQYSAQINNCLTLGDWYSTSPLDEQRLKKLGIHDVEDTILHNPNAYLVVRDIENPGFLKDYFEEKYPQYSLVMRTSETVEGRIYFLYQISGN